MAATMARGGTAVLLHHVYLDESGTHEGSPVMAVAGYVFKSVQAHRFSREWGRALERFKLPYAHMTDCATGNGAYKDMSLEDRIQTEKTLIPLIRNRSAVGFSIAVRPGYYEEKMRGHIFPVSPYSFCLITCVHAISQWAYQNGADKVSYFFEAGHRHQNEANTIMGHIHGSSAFGYVSHAFIDKKFALPLQAADMLAWQSAHFLKRRGEGHKPMRKDFKALVRPCDVLLDVPNDAVDRWMEITQKSQELARDSMMQPGAIPDDLERVLRHMARKA
jgi:hypothetical protein